MVKFLFLLVAGCAGSSSSDVSVDAVNNLLSQSACTSAYESIYSIYSSAATNNAVRLAMASTYGCLVGIDLMALLGNLVGFKGNLAGSGFFEFLVQEFPSIATPVDDKMPHAAEQGIDAALAIVNGGTFFLPAYTVNSTGHNPGSLLVSDRTSDANSYLTFLSMGLMGSILSRYGSVNAAHHRTVDLPWIFDRASVTPYSTPPWPVASVADGCALASGMLHFVDAVGSIEAHAISTVSGLYSKMGNFLLQGLDLACFLGCTECALQGGVVTCPVGMVCPMTLRDRSSCQNSINDINTCAAAGIAYFINTEWTKD